MDPEIIAIAAAGAAILLLGEMMTSNEAYYGDGGQAKYTHFLLYQCRPDLFREIRTVHIGPKSVTHQQAFNQTLLPIWRGTLADVWLRIA
jgi:hypothetical protein